MLNDKKIAILVPLYIGGGAEKITDMIFEPLIKRYGYEVTLISVKMNERTRQRAAALGYNIKDLSAFGNDFNAPDAAREILRELIDSQARHIVYVGVCPIRAEEYRRQLPGRNIIFHLHTMPMWEPIVKLLSSRRYVLALDSATKYIQWYTFKYLKEKIFKAYTHRYARKYRRQFANVDHVVCLTDSYCKLLRKICKNDNVDISVIYNPFDDSELSKLASLPKRNEVLYLGRMHCVEKGVDHLLRAWARVQDAHPDWTLKLVGEGPDKGYLENLAATLNLKNYSFLPYSSNIGEHLSDASILCLPSNVEGWGMVLVEAMAAGVVPIAFGCSGGVRELLADERGIIVKPGNDKSLALALTELMSSPEQRNKRRKLYPEYLQSFTTDTAVDKFLSLLQ